MLKTFVKPTIKGQITIPIKMRKELGVEEATILAVVLDGGKIILNPVRINEEPPRLYSNNEIDEFLKLDKISSTDARFLKKILKIK